MGVALKEDAFAETLLAAVVEEPVELAKLEVMEAEDVCGSDKAEVVQQRTKRAGGRNCMLLRRVARVR